VASSEKQAPPKIETFSKKVLDKSIKSVIIRLYRKQTKEKERKEKW
jgi:hypothetical protein